MQPKGPRTGVFINVEVVRSVSLRHSHGCVRRSGNRGQGHVDRLFASGAVVRVLEALRYRT